MKNIIEIQKEYFKTNQTKDYSFRIEMLKKLKASIINYQDQIIEALYLDLNKSETEAISTEIWLVLKEIDFYLKNLKKWIKPKRVKINLISIPGKSYRFFTPLGVNLIISPWNYPFQLTFLPLASSIAAGNTTIVKPSNYSVNTSNVIKEIIDNTFENKFVACFLGGRKEASFLLEQDFDHIFFTGSPEVGKIVLSSAAKNLTKVTLELGGKSPCIIDDTINLKVAAKRIAFGKLINCGQTCVAPDYLICKESQVDDLIDNLKIEFNKSYPDGYLNNPTYPKIISSRHFERLISLLENQDLVYGGNYNKDSLKIEPTIIKTNLDNPLMKEEIFGPIFPVITYKDDDEIEKIIDQNPYPLAFYLFSNDKSLINHLTKSVSYGGGCINDTLSHLINEDLPFGGIKNSGHGSYHGFKSLEVFSHQVSIYHKHPRFDFNLKYMPYSQKTKKLLKRIFLPKKKSQ